MSGVEIRFTGSAGGAVGAARETSLAIDKVKVSAAGSSAPLRGMEKDLGGVERSATAGSGAFRGLGRSIIFAGGAFLGAVGFVEVVKSSIDVVLAAQTSLVKLDRAVVNAHASVKALTPILDAHAAAARLLGFNDDQTREAEAKLVTAFGATKKALDQLKTAEDLARMSHMDLSEATRLLILMQEGNARAAKQFGLSLPDLTKKQWEAKAAADGLNIAQEKGKTLYDELLPRIKDQAKAYAASPAGKIAEFHAEVQHLQESIGTGLLPVVDKYLTSVDAWLAKGKNQKRVTDDVKKVVGELSSALHDAKTATEDVLKVANPVVKALGGWKTAIEALVALKFASMLKGWTNALKGLIGTEAAGTGLLGAGGAAGGLLGRLRALTLAPFIVSVLFELSNKGEVQKKQPPGSVAYNGGYVDPATGEWVLLFNGQTYHTGIPAPGYKAAGQGTVPSPVGGAIPGKGVQIPSVISPTHQTAGLPGFPAVDIMAKPGTKILAPENGVITRISGSEPTQPPPEGQGGPWGLSIYFLGTETGNTYYLTHLVKVAALGGYKRGDTIGLIGDYPGSAADHVHVGIHAGDSPEAHVGSGMFAPSDFLGGARKTSPYGPDPGSGGGGGGGGGTTKAKKTPWVGVTQGAINTALGSVAATLRGLPATLDPVEKNAVAHIEALKKQLVPHMTAADEATVKVELAKWGKVLNTEITKNAKVVAAAAAAAKQVFDRALSLDVSSILRGFDESYAAQTKAFNTVTSRNLKDMQTAFAKQQAAFDAETQKGLQGFVVAQTGAEAALVAFDAANAASDEAKQRADIASQIADTQAQLDALGTGTPDSTSGGGTLIDISTGIKTTLAANAVAGTDIVAQRKTLLDQLASLQAQSDTLDRQDQRAALQTAADASRTAADAQTTAQQQAYQDARDALKQALQDKETDLEQAYQDQRDLQAQALQDINDDQKVALQQHLDDLGLSLTNHLITWQGYLDALAKMGVGTTGLVNPTTGQVGGSSSTYDKLVSGVLRTAPLGTNIAMATGGTVPGQFVGREDTVMARLTPGEIVLPRALVAALESGSLGGGSGPTVAIFKIDGREFARATAQPMSAEQARQIGYTIQRG